MEQSELRIDGVLRSSPRKFQISLTGGCVSHRVLASVAASSIASPSASSSASAGGSASTEMLPESGGVGTWVAMAAALAL